MRNFYLSLGCLLWLAAGCDSSSSEPDLGCQEGRTLCSLLCVDLERNAKHCGACGVACPEGERCVDGKCGTCEEGRLRCEGACIDPLSDVEHCGACGASCEAGQVCEQGKCEGCPTGTTDCEGGCTDLMTDDENCGACGAACEDGRSCVEGSCTCTAPMEECDGACLAVLEDPANCGACGNVCGEGLGCVEGVCTCSDASFEICGGACVDTQEDMEHCGACNSKCVAGPHASAAHCIQGACVLDCEGESRANCDGDPSTGCEVDLETDDENCGQCGINCLQAPNAVDAYCQAGLCRFDCDEGWDDCDLDPLTGCETSITSVEHCGACNNNCKEKDKVADATCEDAACKFVCQDGWSDCDGSQSNGCETDIENDREHCGACDNACTAFCEKRGCIDVEEVAVGAGTTCARMSNGRIFCWGDGEKGQLGTGIPGSTAVPDLPVQGIEDAVGITMGASHACALLASGKVKCWGANNHSQLGDGTTDDSPIPVEVPDLEAVTQLDAFAQHTCAVVQGGKVKCWGYASSLSWGDAGVDFSKPVEIPGITDAVNVQAGGTATCLLLSSKKVQCWGGNMMGELGRGSTAFTPQPVDFVVNLDGVEQLSGGEATFCAVLAGGDGRCWGSNGSGQVGNGAVGWTGVTQPTAVVGLSKIVELSTGGSHTCARLEDDSLHCWGYRDNGRIGDGVSDHPPFANLLVPAEVLGVSDATALLAGHWHSCALLANRALVCWGTGTNGELGDGNKQDSYLPTSPRWK